MVIDTSLLNTQQYKVRIKGKVEQSRERSSALPTPLCSSYLKGSLLVDLDYGCELFYNFTLILNVFWCSRLTNIGWNKFLLSFIAFGP